MVIDESADMIVCKIEKAEPVCKIEKAEPVCKIEKVEPVTDSDESVSDLDIIVIDDDDDDNSSPAVLPAAAATAMSPSSPENPHDRGEPSSAQQEIRS